MTWRTTSSGPMRQICVDRSITAAVLISTSSLPLRPQARVSQPRTSPENGPRFRGLRGRCIARFPQQDQAMRDPCATSRHQHNVSHPGGAEKPAQASALDPRLAPVTQITDSFASHDPRMNSFVLNYRPASGRPTRLRRLVTIASNEHRQRQISARRGRRSPGLARRIAL